MASDRSLDVGRLRLLREVAVRGSIAAAARSLGLTGSAVSQQLAVLEREAGARLLDRSPRGVVLTGAGAALVERAAQIADLLAAARADLDRLGGAAAGTVRVAAVASAAATLVSAAVSVVAERAPQVAVSVVAAEPRRSVELLLADHVDLAVVDEYDHVPLALPDHLTGVALHAEPLVTVTASGSGASGSGAAGPARLADLADADWVLPPDDAACGRAVRLACREAGFEPRVRWETDDMLLLLRAVAAGHGVSVLPRLAVPEDVAGVTVGALGAPRLHRRLSALTRRGAGERAAVREVLVALGAAAATQGDGAGRTKQAIADADPLE